MPSIEINVTLVIVTLLSVFATIISFFTVRMIRQIDKSQSELWDKMDNTRERLSTLEGEHRAFTKIGSHHGR